MVPGMPVVVVVNPEAGAHADLVPQPAKDSETMRSVAVAAPTIRNRLFLKSMPITSFIKDRRETTRVSSLKHVPV